MVNLEVSLKHCDTQLYSSPGKCLCEILFNVFLLRYIVITPVLCVCEKMVLKGKRKCEQTGRDWTFTTFGTEPWTLLYNKKGEKGKHFASCGKPTTAEEHQK